jgi:hypothetical protein
MPKATRLGGPLKKLEKCYIRVPPGITIPINNLPDISDSKSASYTDESIMGRSSPVKVFSSGENRVISFQLHLFVTDPEDVFLNLNILRALQSCLYPREAENNVVPFIPPPICRLRCGDLLSRGDNSELCVILTDCSVTFPTDVAWDEETFTPYKFDIDTTWNVVYKSSDLPGQSRILFTGR